ncbi:MAG: single-stranded-DNA-specific exonuclease RecJ [Myxococcota bacterium]
MEREARARVRWECRDIDVTAVSALASGLSLPEPLARVLAARHIHDVEAAQRYLEPRLQDLPDPARLAGSSEALERLQVALRRDETIGIFGDYDVDGVTSTTLLWDFLEGVGGRVVATLPDRLREGYGLSRAGVDRLRDAGATLVVTVDCGVTAHEEVDYCKTLGIDVIVIDHHTVPVTLPAATAVINPHRADCDTGAEHLCAVGVTFNLCSALRRRLRKTGWFSMTRPEPDLRQALDLVALGTIADVVPLVDDNRIFVRHGLKVIAAERRLGMGALLEVAGVSADRVNAGTLGFQLGPRVNAAGRLGDAMTAVEMLRAPRRERALELARRLDTENLSRRDLEKRITEEAVRRIEGSTEHRASRCLVVGDDSWHPGVVGIVASRLVERFGKPCVVVGEGGRGSGRSIPAYALYDGLVAAGHTLDGFGGHAHAAGVRVPVGGLERFREALLDHAHRTLVDDDLARVVLYDGDLEVDALDLELCEALQRAAPFGRKNPEPVFRVPGVTPRGHRELKGGHFKATVHPTRRLDAILFGAPERYEDFHGTVDLLGVPDVNEWNGQRSVQLRLKDFRPGERS